MCPPSQDCLQIFFQLLIIGLTNGSAIALNAIGVTLVFSVIRTINFAYGDIFALTTVLVGTIISRLQLDTETNSLAWIGGLFIALGAAMLVASALNVAVERIAFRPFRSTSRLAPLIATLGISFILYQAALIWRRFEPSFHPGEHRSVPGLPEIPKGGFGEVLPQTDLFQTFGIQTNITFLFKDFWLLLIAIIFAWLVSWLLYRTKIGLSLRAVAQNPELAQYCGLDLNKIIRRAFMIGGALSGAAAFIFTIYYTHPFGQHGLQSGLIAFAAAILGGIGRPWGAFVSGLFLGVIAAFSDYFLAAQWTPALVQVLLIALLVLRPTGVESEKENNDLLSVAPRDMITRIPRDLKTRRNVWLAAGAMVLAILFPLLDQFFGLGQQGVVTGIAIFAIFALGLNLVLGYAGLLDLGHAASFGIGGYTAAIIMNPWGKIGSQLPQPIDFILVLALSAGVTGIFGIVNGMMTMRLRSDYLAIVTIAFGQIVPQVVVNLREWTDGIQGIAALSAPTIFAYALQTPTERYFLTLIILGLVTLASRRLLFSRIGRAWIAIGDDELAAASSGINLVRYKTLAFVLGTMVAGVAGALYVSVFSYIDPDQIGFRISAMVLAMVIIGGAGSVTGVIVGTILIGVYDRIAIPLLGAVLDTLRNANGAWTVGDVRQMNYFSFGLALYFSVLFFTRRRVNESH